MKLKYKFTAVTIDNEIHMIPINSGGNFNGVLTVNETMKDIMELLGEDLTEDEITLAMMGKYKNVTKEEMAKSIRDICLSLENEGLLVK